MKKLQVAEEGTCSFCLFMHKIVIQPVCGFSCDEISGYPDGEKACCEYQGEKQYNLRVKRDPAVYEVTKDVCRVKEEKMQRCGFYH